MPRKTKTVAITTRLCESHPRHRIKVYDEECPGFYVSITPKGVATFYLKYWDRALRKQVPILLGVYDRDHISIPVDNVDDDLQCSTVESDLDKDSREASLSFVAKESYGDDEGGDSGKAASGGDGKTIFEQGQIESIPT